MIKVNMKKANFKFYIFYAFMLAILSSCHEYKSCSGKVIDKDTNLPIENVSFSDSKNFRNPKNKMTNIFGEFSIDKTEIERDKIKKIVLYKDGFQIEYLKIKKLQPNDTIFLTKRLVVPIMECP